MTNLLALIGVALVAFQAVGRRLDGISSTLSWSQLSNQFIGTEEGLGTGEEWADSDARLIGLGENGAELDQNGADLGESDEKLGPSPLVKSYDSDRDDAEHSDSGEYSGDVDGSAADTDEGGETESESSPCSQKACVGSDHVFQLVVSEEGTGLGKVAGGLEKAAQTASSLEQNRNIPAADASISSSDAMVENLLPSHPSVPTPIATPHTNE